jgi:hypothetical protein
VTAIFNCKPSLSGSLFGGYPSIARRSDARATLEGLQVEWWRSKTEISVRKMDISKIFFLTKSGGGGNNERVIIRTIAHAVGGCKNCQ